LAAHVDLLPGAPVRVGRRIVALLEIRGVALRAHQVRVLEAPRPVQGIIRGDPLSRVQREPALLARVPGDGQALEPPPGKLHEVLLEGGDPEGVLDLEVGQLAVSAFGVDEELAVAREEARGDAVLAEGASRKSPSTVPAVAGCIARW